MEKRFTPAQRSAINARDCDLAVSAAAGSGKTTVLTERILSLLSKTDGIDAARLVVVTFTKAAAQELEDRLYTALSEKVAASPDGRHLSRQLLRLARAQISTIHSFAFSLIREHRRELGLGERVRIADPAEASVLERQAVESAVRGFFETQEEAVLERREVIYRLFGTGRSSAGLTEAVIRLLHSAASYPGGLSLLIRRQKEAEEMLAAIGKGELSFWDTPFGEEVQLQIRESLIRGLDTLSALMEIAEGSPLLREKYLPFFRERHGDLSRVLDLANKGCFAQSGDELRAALSRRMPVIRSCPPEEAEQKELCKSVWGDRVKKELSRLAQELLPAPFPDPAAEMEESISLSKALLSLAEDAGKRYEKEKRERDLVDYADLEHLTLALLMEQREGQWQKKPLADEIAREYDAVFVDEYQDTNAIQDMIFRAISLPGRLFVVGDPKQSIYRFRGAEPTIFARYKNELPLYSPGKRGWQKILLSENFRCDESVIRLVNRLFRVVMDETAPDSLYQEEDCLRYSKKNKAEHREYPAELIFVEKPPVEEEPEGEDAVLSCEENREAAYLAGRIGQMLSQGEEKEAGVPFEPGDIAVICRTHLQIDRVKRSLEERGIPCTAEGGESLKEKAEYLFVTSLLSALDNPMRDIPLLGALSSPVFRFSPDALYRIRKQNKKMPFYTAMLRYSQVGTHAETREMCRETLEILDQLREQAAELSLPAFLFTLYRRFAIEELYREEAKGAVKEALFAAAQRAETGQVNTPGGFCRYLEEAELSAPAGTDGVHLMTIHKSKGLEFPVVFVSFLAQNFSIRDETPTLLISPELGAWTLLPRLAGRAKFNTLMRKALRIRLHREGLEEAKRVLYVALTRARSRLILTASPEKMENLARDLLLPRKGDLSPGLIQGQIKGAGSPLGQFLPALSSSDALARVLQGEELAEEDGFVIRRAQPLPFALWQGKKEEEASAAGFDAEQVLRSLSFTYDKEYLLTLPEKLSVSQLLRERRQEEAPELFPRRLMDFERGMLTTGAERIGTATHEVMQYASFAAMEKDPEGELSRLVERGFLTAEDMALVEKDKVIAFFSSPLYEEMKRSPRVEHEKRFNVLLPAQDLGVSREGEILVQGVVDAWFENPDGSLTLLDFKTDRVHEPEGEEVLRHRHGDQLRLYSRAVEELTGKKVTALFLYSFSLGRAISVEP